MCSSALKRALKQKSGGRKARKIKGSSHVKRVVPTMKPLDAQNAEK